MRDIILRVIIILSLGIAGLASAQKVYEVSNFTKKASSKSKSENSESEENENEVEDTFDSSLINYFSVKKMSYLLSINDPHFSCDLNAQEVYTKFLKPPQYNS